MNLNGWSPGLPRIPGHYWIMVPGFEREPQIETIEDHGAGLIVHVEQHGYLPLAEVWSDPPGVLWWGPLEPPALP